MNIFQETQMRNPESNNFDLSHDRKFSMQMGRLTPCLTMEIIPGDSISAVSEQLLRLPPMVSPVMHEINVKTEYFFVPNRLLWDNWERFITNPTEVINPAPYITANIPVGSLGDYLGYATGKSHNHNPLPFSAYLLIYNEYYRDQNLIPPISYKLTDGDNSMEEFPPYLSDQPLRRAWEHDYFTSALPFAQKGDPVTLSIGTEAPLLYKPDYSATLVDYTDTPDLGVTAGRTLTTTGSSAPFSSTLRDTVSGENWDIDVTPNTVADLTDVTAITVNDLRIAVRLQEFLEKNARGGTRYIESIKSHFGVNSSDSRLQRPEFLGGGKSTISISEVLQMSSSDEETPQGNMAGHGINASDSRAFKRTFEEHGFIIGICTVIPRTAYINPMPKWSFRFDPLEYAWPSFANLGEQEILSKEVDGYVGDDTIFGYIPKYSEYKFMQNTVHGEFKTSLDYWHLARKFTTEPFLNSSFINSNPDNRIFAVTDSESDKVYVHMYHRINARRKLPRYGIPNL